MPAKLTIVSVAAETAPFSKAGGIADVARALPRALHRLGHTVVAVTPLHGSIHVVEQKLEKIASNVPVVIDEHATRYADFWRSELMEGLPVYFIDNHKYFSSHKRIYGSTYQNTRYLFFDVAVFKLLTLLNIAPNIMQCHDWQTGLIPQLLSTRFRNEPLFRATRTVYTINNLTFQFGQDWWRVPTRWKDDGRGALPPFTDKRRVEHTNFAKRAILHADIINTVSETYREEILTQEFGQDLHRILHHRQDRLFGIVNGIDLYDYNPATDPGLYRNYDADSLHVKTKNKLFLQRSLGLPEDASTPVIAMVSRISEQKGFGLLRDIVESLLRMDLQFAVLGGGDREYVQFLRSVMRKHPKRFAGKLEFSADIATQFYAGSDMFLMPSRFEPCGLGQLISLRYGSVPVVRATGGLVDTVTDYNPRTEKGNGFVFKTYDSRDLLVAITRALETHRRPEVWQQLVRNGMRQSFSWEIPARKYVRLFRKAMTIKRQES